MRVLDRRDRELRPAEDGVFELSDVETYFVETELPLPQFKNVTRVVPGSNGRLTEIKFLNFVGEGRIGPLRYRVSTPKLTDSELGCMLDDVVSVASSLPFGVDSPTAHGFEIDVSSQEIPFHLLAWIRHVMLRDEDSLVGHFRQVARYPHRRMDAEQGVRASWLASSVGPAALVGMITRPDRLVGLSAGHRLLATSAADRLGGRFPLDVQHAHHVEDFDTHENRLVKAVLAAIREVLRRFEVVTFRSAVLEREIAELRETTDWMLQHDFLESVGALSQVPMQSTVMQRRPGYREFMSHFLTLRGGCGLLDGSTAAALLDAKNVALLYELWSFFEVRKCLESLLGPPASVSILRADELQLQLAQSEGAHWSSTEQFDQRVELTYNCSFTAPESYSLPMRPDIVVRAGGRTLVFDAKFKFAEVSEGTGAEERLQAKREDFLKMHAYRDAIRDVRGAYVLYPGTDIDLFAKDDGWGVGALPLVPGGCREELVTMLALFLAETVT